MAKQLSLDDAVEEEEVLGELCESAFTECPKCHNWVLTGRHDKGRNICGFCGAQVKRT